MQIVIDIPYKDFEKLATFGQFNPLDLSLAVERGIVLPKGHGRLIDASDLEKSLINDSRQAFTKHQVWLMFSKYNKNVPTILEVRSEE